MKTQRRWQPHLSPPTLERTCSADATSLATASVAASAPPSAPSLPACASASSLPPPGDRGWSPEVAAVTAAAAAPEGACGGGWGRWGPGDESSVPRRASRRGCNTQGDPLLHLLRRAELPLGRGRGADAVGVCSLYRSEGSGVCTKIYGRRQPSHAHLRGADGRAVRRKCTEQPADGGDGCAIGWLVHGEGSIVTG